MHNMQDLSSTRTFRIEHERRVERICSDENQNSEKAVECHRTCVPSARDCTRESENIGEVSDFASARLFPGCAAALQYE